MPPYCPFYCEENAWQLCRSAQLVDVERAVLFIRNAERACPLFAQRAGRPADGLVIWDYHVVVVAQAPKSGEWQIWDPDTLLAVPCSADEYLKRTFADVGRLPGRYHPRLRWVDGATFSRRFSSDRRHMRLSDGSFSQPPPQWALIRGPEAPGPHGLDAFLDVDDTGLGPWLSLDECVGRV